MSVWAKWKHVGLVASGLLLVMLATGLLWPELWRVNRQEWIWVPAVLVTVGTLFAPGERASIRAVSIWFGVPALLYLFFVAQPRTHIHTIFPAWSVLSGIGIAHISQWIARRSKVALRIAIVVGIAIYALCGAYTMIIFVDHTPEYQRTFPEFKNPLYWTPYRYMPDHNLFGFPYRAGWNVVGYLIDRGELSGSYNSNEKADVTHYYTRQALRLGHGDIDIYILAQDVQDKVNIHWEQVRTGYEPTVVVTVGGQPKLTIYERDVDESPMVLAARG
jgi:hypothetical protein